MRLPIWLILMQKRLVQAFVEVTSIGFFVLMLEFQALFITLL
jgi:hypothetical protein